MAPTEPRSRARGLIASFAVIAASIVAIPGVATASPKRCDGHTVTISGTSAPDTIVGTSGRDVIDGGAGKDHIRGLGGDDIICGGPGKDTIYGNAGDDIIFGETGGDRIRGGKGDDELRGGNGNDRIFGKAGADEAFGGFYSDVCHAEREHKCELNRRRGYDPDHWRHLLDVYFGDIDQVSNALKIIDCESRGEPFALNPNSEAAGLFQFLPSTWKKRSAKTEFAGETPYHPRANVAAARVTYDAWVDWLGSNHGWDAWNCKRVLSSAG
jgi:Ca2+-binding RTX toxin-like protein